MPALLLDVLLLSWIYLALTSTLRVLSEFRQSYKLQLYQRLATTIAVFASLFALVTFFVMMDQYSLITWPWQW